MTKYFDFKAETAPRGTLRDIQGKRLRDTVRRVYERVPFYRRKMEAAGVRPEEIRSVDDLPRLPFSCKKDLSDCYPFGLFAVPLREIVRLHTSSGTTGRQIVVGYTKNDLEVLEGCVARALTAAGCTDEDLVHISYGYGLFTGGLGADGGARRIGATAVPVSSGNTRRQVMLLRDFGSTVLCCTPSYALHIAEVMREEGVSRDELRLRVGIFGAEPWTDGMRTQLERELGLRAYDIYGLTEIIGPGVAYECEMRDGMHINEDHFIAEVINPDTGEVLPDGEQGELVFTCITKEAFPVLRYRTRDIGTVSRGVCPCGRTFAKMTKPCGRSDDMLIVRGVNVFPSQIETVLLRQGYTANYRIVVDRAGSSDSIEVQVEISGETFSDTVRGLSRRADSLAEALKSLLGIQAQVTLLAPNTIPRAGGKAVRVIDRRKLTD